MAHEYRVTWCKDEELQAKLKEWTGQEPRWELVTATAIVSGMGKFGVTYHYLYFRRELPLPG